RLEGTGVIFTVEQVQDIRNGVKDRRVWTFGERPSWKGPIELIRPNSNEPLVIDPENVRSIKDLMILVGDPTRFVITGVYPSQGRLAEVDKKSHKRPVTRHEPIAVVGVDRVGADGAYEITSPVLLA